jgi:5-formyltetrahydrofolate cyclo-ligase
MRSAVLGLRDAMTAARRADDAALCSARLLALPAFIKAKTVLSYMSFGTEIDTQTVFGEALKQNKVVALPRMIKDQSSPATSRLALHTVNSESELASGKWGIREPRETCPGVALDAVDLVLVPGVAFDRRGDRLGYGKGYYDRLLPARRSNCLLVALAFDCQLVDDVPVSAHDVPIDFLITPSQQLSFST